MTARDNFMKISNVWHIVDVRTLLNYYLFRLGYCCAAVISTNCSSHFRKGLSFFNNKRWQQDTNLCKLCCVHHKKKAWHSQVFTSQTSLVRAEMNLVVSELHCDAFDQRESSFSSDVLLAGDYNHQSCPVSPSWTYPRPQCGFPPWC